MVQQFVDFFRTLQKFVHRPWYVPVAALLAGLDLFILIIPTDGILLSAVLLRPSKWVATFLWLSFGSAAGSFALTEVLQAVPVEWVNGWIKMVLDHGTWQQTQDFVSNYGWWALCVTSFSFLPLQPAVVIGALAQLPASEVFVSVLLGRLIKFGALSWIASHAPKLIQKIPLVRKELEALHRPPPSEHVSPPDARTSVP